MHQTRESWLTEAAAHIATRLFEPLKLELPKILRVSCGFCGNSKLSGFCVKPECAEDLSTNIFVDPLLAEPMVILATLVHEIAHAHCFALGLECGHKGKFVKVIREIGLVGKATATTVDAGSHLDNVLQDIAMTLGDYPHSPVRRTTKERKPHAWVTFVSVGHEDEYMVRANKHTVKEFGPPKDPHGEDMVPKEPSLMEDEESDIKDKVEDLLNTFDGITVTRL